MITKQFNMTEVRRKPEVGFHWKLRWLDPHEQWFWTKVYVSEPARRRAT